MQTFDTITAARDALFGYRYTGMVGLPADVIEQVGKLCASPSPVDQIVRTGELLYARKVDLNDAGRSLAGGLIAFATVNAWHGLLEGDRGNGMVQALRRDLNETPPSGHSWPLAANDPAPLTEFVAAPTPAPAPPPTAV